MESMTIAAKDLTSVELNSKIREIGPFQCWVSMKVI